MSSTFRLLFFFIYIRTRYLLFFDFWYTDPRLCVTWSPFWYPMRHVRSGQKIIRKSVQNVETGVWRFHHRTQSSQFGSIKEHIGHSSRKLSGTTSAVRVNPVGNTLKNQPVRISVAVFKCFFFFTLIVI